RCARLAESPRFARLRRFASPSYASGPAGPGHCGLPPENARGPTPPGWKTFFGRHPFRLPNAAFFLALEPGTRLAAKHPEISPARSKAKDLSATLVPILPGAGRSPRRIFPSHTRQNLARESESHHPGEISPDSAASNGNPQRGKKPLALRTSVEPRSEMPPHAAAPEEKAREPSASPPERRGVRPGVFSRCRVPCLGARGNSRAALKC